MDLKTLQNMKLEDLLDVDLSKLNEEEMRYVEKRFIKNVNRRIKRLKESGRLSSSKLLVAKYLSSGEKNLLLLYFHIIFKSPDSISDDETFIELIDEPEVSMHPAWLMNFVDSLKHINEVLDRKDNYQYIITTHSPGITYANSKLMVELKRELKNDQ